MRNELGSITDLGDGRFRVSVSLGYDRRTGKRYRPSRVVHGTKADAKAALSRMLAEGGKVAADKLTVTAFMEDVWLPTKSGRRARTVEGYASKIRSCITPYIGHLPLKAIDGYAVERWLRDLARDGKSPQTVIHARSVLKNAMRAAVRWHHIAYDPTVGTELPSVEYQPRILSDEQMRAYITAFSGHALEPIILLALTTGMRRSELAALDWSDIDFDAATVTVWRGYHERGGKTWFEKPKSRTSRRVLDVRPYVLERLRSLRAVGPLVPDGADRMSPSKIARLYTEHVTACGLPRVTIRELRNTYGTFLRRHGANVSDIAEIFGHVDERITKEHYIDRESLPVNTAAAAIVDGLFVRHRAPDSEAKHGKNRQETVSGSQEFTADAL